MLSNSEQPGMKRSIYSSTQCQTSSYGCLRIKQELLGWHQRLGHIAFKKVQHLMKSGFWHTQRQQGNFAQSCMQGKHSKMCRLPICQTKRNCQTNCKGQRGNNQSKSTTPRPRGMRRPFHLFNKGRLYTSRGASKESDMYFGGALFIDQSLGYVHVEFQTSLIPAHILNKASSLISTFLDVQFMCLKSQLQMVKSYRDGNRALIDACISVFLGNMPVQSHWS